MGFGRLLLLFARNHVRLVFAYVLRLGNVLTTGVGEGRGVLSALRWVGRELFSILGVGEGCGVVSTLR